jgi:hypothetical protein
MLAHSPLVRSENQTDPEARNEMGENLKIVLAKFLSMFELIAWHAQALSHLELKPEATFFQVVKFVHGQTYQALPRL